MTVTYEQFLKTYASPHHVWASLASSSDREDPGTTKVQYGWQIEKPSHSTFNWWMRRTDTRLDELEKRVAWLVAEKEADNG